MIIMLVVVKGELLCFSIFSDLQMLLQSRQVVLNNAKASHNDVCAIVSEPCSLVHFVSGGFLKICCYSDVSACCSLLDDNVSTL